MKTAYSEFKCFLQKLGYDDIMQDISIYENFELDSTEISELCTEIRKVYKVEINHHELYDKNVSQIIEIINERSS